MRYTYIALINLKKANPWTYNNSIHKKFEEKNTSNLIIDMSLHILFVQKGPLIIDMVGVLHRLCSSLSRILISLPSLMPELVGMAKQEVSGMVTMPRLSLRACCDARLCCSVLPEENQPSFLAFDDNDTVDAVGDDDNVDNVSTCDR